MKQKKKRHVLISAAGSGTAYAMVISLRKTWGETVLITTIDINPSHLVTTSLFSNYHIVCPSADNIDYELFITDLITKNDVNLFCPILNNDFKHINSINKNTECQVMAPLLSTDLACSKAATVRWLKSIGLPSPPIFSKSDIHDEQMYFAKPDNGFGSNQSRIVTGREAFKLLDSDFIIQPLCFSPEITVDSFFDIETGYGRAVARERIETKSGVCTKARVYEDDDLSELAYRIGKALHQKGTICFQVMTLDAKYVITDLNFRPGAGTAITVAAGVDLLSAAFACHWNLNYHQFVSASIPKEGVFVTRQYTEFVMR